MLDTISKQEIIDKLRALKRWEVASVYEQDVIEKDGDYIKSSDIDNLIAELEK